MIPAFLLEQEKKEDFKPRKSRNVYFVDKTVKNMAGFLASSILHWETSAEKGFLQSISSRIKVIFTLVFIVLTSFFNNLPPLAAISFTIFILLLVSKVPLFSTYKKIIGITFFFGFLVFLPASLNLFSKGEVIIPLIQFDRDYQWQVYHIPAELGFTKEGLLLVFRLCLKVFNSVSLTMLLMHTTSFEKIVKALRTLRVPEIFLLTLTMSYKYIFILSKTIIETYQALRMRWWNRGRTTDADNIIAGRLGYLFRKSWERYELVYRSMLARGYTGAVMLNYHHKLRRNDYIFILASLVLALFLIFLNYHVAAF